MMNSNQFSIGLPESSNYDDFSLLLKRLTDDLKKAGDKNNIFIESLYMESPFEEGGSPRLYVEYSLRESEIALVQNGYVRLVVNTLNDNEQEKLQGTIFRLKSDSGQVNYIFLLEEIIRYLKKLGKIKVLDFIYHDCLDEKGNENPFISMYWIK